MNTTKKLTVILFGMAMLLSIPVFAAEDNSLPGLDALNADALKTPPSGVLSPYIAANGTTSSLMVDSTTPISIDIGIDGGNNAGGNVDWWLCANTPVGWYSWVYPTGWQAGLLAAGQGPLSSIPASLNVYSAPLPVGQYTFYFGVDSLPNGVLNMSPSSLKYDSVQVNVSEMIPKAVALKPDLVITKVTSPASGMAGGKANVSAIVKNQGISAATAFNLGFFFSKDTAITTGDVAANDVGCNVPSLARGATFTCSRNIAVPATLAAGTYYLGAYADKNAKVAESNEANNGRAAANSIVISKVVTPSSGTVSATCTDANFTLARYNAITKDMTMAQVKQAIGCNFDPTSTLAFSDFVGHSWKFMDMTTYSIKMIRVYFDATDSFISSSMGDSFKSRYGF
jgi:hypothetical protein